MKHRAKADNFPEILGVASIGSRGQIVIPKEARAALGLNPGDNLITMVHSDKLIFIPKKELKKFVKHLTSHLNI